MNLRRTPIAFAIFLCLSWSGSSFGQAWSGILSPSRAIDWSHAGATISTSRTQCVTSQCASVSGGNVTSASVDAAISSAPASTFVLIPAGTFVITNGITFSSKSNITLRGSGSNSTFLIFAGANSGGPAEAMMCAPPARIRTMRGGPSNSASWTGTNGASGAYVQGASSILVSSISNLAVGNPIILDQLDDHSDPGSGHLYVGCEGGGAGWDPSTACYAGAGPNGFERGSNSPATIRGQQQIVNVTSISGTGPYNVGITPGIYADNWRSSQSPGAWWASNPVRGDAVENISLDHTAGGDGITFLNCTGCWVKGIRSVRASITGTAWSHVYLAICNHCTVRDSYFTASTGTATELMWKSPATFCRKIISFNSGAAPVLQFRLRRLRCQL